MPPSTARPAGRRSLATHGSVGLRGHRLARLHQRRGEVVAAQCESTDRLGVGHESVFRDAAVGDIAQAIDAGEPEAQIKRGLRMPSRAADRLIADARRTGVDRLRAALEQIADLELASRGGMSGGQSEDTSAIRTIQLIAG